MSILFNFLEEIIDYTELMKYQNIFYLGSCSDFDIAKFNECLIKNQINDFISKCDVDSGKDSMEFFVFVHNNQNSDLVLIWNPVELFDSSKIFQIVKNLNDEDFTKLPSFDKII